VDGLQFAIKDTAGAIVTILIFGGSLAIARPILRLFFVQIVNPDTPARQAALADLLNDRAVFRALMLGTLIVALENVLAGAVNIYLNLTTVVAAFGTEAFNQQVAQVNVITRVFFPIPSLIAFGLAIWLVYRTVYQRLPQEAGKSQWESDFWELVALREARQSR
jgi:hypothetical protein